ncbi:DUF302 domain-containing protein [Sphingomonas edaphi]|uniref:DUF302 domain-containing protein n=1 Tax=Sphingomonas edaphi TaxID=2315689 RepID=A0A418PZA7_9SPHN|nr:DUF302 domain-containing protein [Sphingomonas edaphi]RIX27474.1 DUF302 domain-containing protein [Sphingomonas edaphi]
MTYYISTQLDLGFDDAIAATEAALKDEGFGVVTRIDMAQTLQSKMGVDFRDYVILGACNPKLAYEALQLEDKVGTMLPCNVVIQALGNGRTEVAAIDPVASMQAIENQQLTAAASEVRERLQRVIQSLDGNAPGR